MTRRHKLTRKFNHSKIFKLAERILFKGQKKKKIYKGNGE